MIKPAIPAGFFNPFIMAEYDVNLEQLQEICNHFVTTSYPYFEELREAFKLLRITGCRIQEIFEIERWSIVSGYEVTCQPQKGNQIRYITLNSDFSSFLVAIENQYKPFLGRTVSQLEYLFNKINPYGGLFSGDRSILSYIYRYCYIRELHADGLSDAQIADIMGHNNPSVISNYLNADLSSQIEIPEPQPTEFVFDGITYPVIEINDKIWTVENLRFDDGLGGIFAPGNDPANVPLFGYNYQFPALSRVESMLPSGWRIPSYADINDLIAFLADNNLSSYDLMSTDPAAWVSVAGTNSLALSLVGSGFSSSYFRQRGAFHRYYPSETVFGFAYVRFDDNVLHTAITDINSTYSFAIRVIHD